MRTQKDGTATLNIRPSFLIVPAAQEDTARVLMTSETDPSKTNSRVPNPVRGAAEIIVDARLDDASTTAWYLAADPNTFDTIEVGYLDGIAARLTGWNTRCVSTRRQRRWSSALCIRIRARKPSIIPTQPAASGRFFYI
jgi:hypothetical protein